MSILNFFRSRKKPATASIAKERLQIIVAHERGQREQPDYLPALRDELLTVIRKYVHIDDDQMNVILDTQENYSVLELNVTLPDR
ncbi:cell division topological specificity factor [Thiopseudomonas alkaliphila]|uniref:Cell division topological specificity factor n=1 Tax=Thiopseudomonas alkaliphila TaxID=1697053 RepID=A0A0K1XFE9_9GAMM|nr:cell division topological specificity factor MinE [Thiopseudomonas alkaliphila]AKX45558.1 cell division topological specificity factor [Thiopseudomonas alkaliphila]AKX46909.1 cell division topological specificity factor [Thiopseudomonas alkaliphila]AKX48858.1 cell division topological specificity factor [Thiopseudomonas alkaliphila]AKX53979.1 cell division topological specificity factor [Thiopseudomonas alkaliphila]AKX55041.1 cell division topological specificity factor [Thiopseudomonas alk